MTHQQLRDLLRDRVAEEMMTDLSGPAWTAGARARRQRRSALVAGAAAGVLAVAGVAGAGSRGTEPQSQEHLQTTPSPDSTGPDATYQAVPIWWSPDQVEERSLPLVLSPLPEEVDLEAGPLAKQIDVAVAAFGIGDRVRLVDEHGAQVSIDVSSLDDVTNENGYRISPVSDSMLSPDGRHLAFAQDGSLVIYDIATGEWSGFSTETATGTAYVDWRDDLTVAVTSTKSGKGSVYDLRGDRVGSKSSTISNVGFVTGEAQPYGPTRMVRLDSAAQSWGMGVPLPVRDGYASAPEFVSANTLEGTFALAFMNEVGDGQDTRWKNCCPVAGWLDDRTMVYESRQSHPALVAWTVGTRQFRLVTRITGEYDVASFATLHEET
jgi:hypothetical protein